MKLAHFIIVLCFLGYLCKAPAVSKKPSVGKLVAYRGGGQLLNYAGFNHHGCGARQIIGSENLHIENTVPAIDRALEVGFDIVHLNVRQTKDKNFVLFHDKTIDCATSGRGKTTDLSYLYLSSLDAGYGYTLDHGQTYPWRNQGYKIPSLTEVLNKYPNTNFWLNLKTDDAVAIESLIAEQDILLRKRNIVHFTRHEYFPLFEANNIDALTMASVKRCVVHYALIGWSRFFPDSCRKTKIIIPPEFTKFIWGWPQNFASTAQKHGSEVFLWIKHRRYKPEYNLLADGIGLVIGDIEGVNSSNILIEYE